MLTGKKKFTNISMHAPTLSSFFFNISFCLKNIIYLVKIDKSIIIMGPFILRNFFFKEKLKKVVKKISHFFFSFFNKKFHKIILLMYLLSAYVSKTQL